MGKPRLLDLFCGGGGAAMGYHRAGFDVVGVDIKPQPHYPFEFVQSDVFEYVQGLLELQQMRDEGGGSCGERFAAIHASPPCQAYTIARNNGCHQGAPDLIAETRTALRALRRPYVIENVPMAPLQRAVLLCGASFGLKTGQFDLNRHRWFECSWGILTPPCQHRAGQTIGVYGNGTNKYHRDKFGRCVTIAEMREAMGIGWMTRKELSQAIPPAYTEFIGKQLIQYLQRKAA